jgi:hypothetical protein
MLEAIAADSPADPLRNGSAIFLESDCPTCRLALERLAAAGVDDVVAVFEDPAPVAARVARQSGYRGPVYAEPAPYATSERLDVRTVPTTIAFHDGAETARVVGWDRDGLAGLLGRSLGADGPVTKPGCAARWTYEATAVDEFEELFDLGFSDGLPVIPPTPERVEAMLDGRDPGQSLGRVPPGGGEATLERVASCAVLAGCKPSYFPTVLAACAAILDERFNLNGLAVTTSPPGQTLIVNGPVRSAIGLNSGMGALGPGWRANMTIGRAVRLLVQLTGAGQPGRLDRSTLGHMGKLGQCIAEAEELGPWTPLHVERGFSADQSTVTALGCDAPLSVSDHRSKAPEQLAATLATAAASTWSPNWWPLEDVTQLFVVCPEHVALLTGAGWSKDDLRTAIFEHPQRQGAELIRFGEAPPAAHADPARTFRKWLDPSQLMIIAAGGEAGRFSAVFGPSLGMGSTPITREIA